jgi:hypothetical protein
LIDMNVHLYAICWNEARMLGFFFRHYAPFVSRFVIYDNGSTDETVELLRARPDVELRRFPNSRPDSYVLSAKALQDECWKESRGRADWVIVTAIDEHIYHPHLEAYLQHCKRRGTTYIPALGFQMLTSDFPAPDEHLATTRTKGAPFHMMSKLRVFDPDAIEETDFGIGGHTAAPRGRLRLPWRDELLLLHYKFLGIDYLRARSAVLRTRMGSHDHGQHWDDLYTERRVENDWQQFADRLVDLRDPAYVPWIDHFEGRWWRRPIDPAWLLRGVLKRAREWVTGTPAEHRGRTTTF